MSLDGWKPVRLPSETVDSMDIVWYLRRPRWIPWRLYRWWKRRLLTLTGGAPLRRIAGLKRQNNIYFVTIANAVDYYGPFSGARPVHGMLPEITYADD